MAFRPSQPRLFWPALFGATLMKKAALYGIARSYGFPRVYRRLLELERKAYPQASPAFRSNLRYGLKQSIRAPDQAMSIIARNPSIIALLGQLGQMKGVTEEMRKKVMDGFSALVKATPGLNEAELWKMAKEEERKHTRTTPR